MQNNRCHRLLETLETENVKKKKERLDWGKNETKMSSEHFRFFFFLRFFAFLVFQINKHINIGNVIKCSVFVRCFSFDHQHLKSSFKRQNKMKNVFICICNVCHCRRCEPINNELHDTWSCVGELNRLILNHLLHRHNTQNSQRYSLMAVHCASSSQIVCLSNFTGVWQCMWRWWYLNCVVVGFRMK